jgi:4-nitrophenyl phosphatase
MTTLHELQALLLDMDGVIYRGNTPLPGAQVFLSWLSERRFPFLLLTNNSTLDSQAYERKLAAMGISVSADQILTSAVATAEYLARNYPPGSRVYIIGESGLEASIAARGFTITDRAPQIVAVGMDRQLTYGKLRTAALAIRAGARFVASNRDRTLPTEAGEEPGAGAIVAALVAATDQQPLVIGKPEPGMLELGLAKLASPPEHTAIVGDRLETDILGGQRLGMPTILVLSGVTREAPLDRNGPRPTWVFDSVQEIYTAWQQSLSV